jgi:uncharacterized protein
MSITHAFEHFSVLEQARSGVARSGELTSLADSAELARVFDRLQAEACEPSGLTRVAWRVHAELRTGASGESQPWLTLVAEARVRLICQRCLLPADVVAVTDRWFRFVSDEATAAAEDDVSDEDVLVLEPRINLLQLLEDELLMALPLVPMHDMCPVEVPMAVSDAEFEAELVRQSSPFAGLAPLKLRSRVEPSQSDADGDD